MSSSSRTCPATQSVNRFSPFNLRGGNEIQRDSTWKPWPGREGILWRGNRCGGADGHVRSLRWQERPNHTGATGRAQGYGAALYDARGRNRRPARVGEDAGSACIRGPSCWGAHLDSAILGYVDSHLAERYPNRNGSGLPLGREHSGRFRLRAQSCFVCEVGRRRSTAAEPRSNRRPGRPVPTWLATATWLVIRD